MEAARPRLAVLTGVLINLVAERLLAVMANIAVPGSALRGTATTFWVAVVVLLAATGFASGVSGYVTGALAPRRESVSVIWNCVYSWLVLMLVGYAMQEVVAFVTPVYLIILIPCGLLGARVARARNEPVHVPWT